MKKYFLKGIFLLIISGLMISCSNSKKLDVEGDPQAIQMAESMLEAMGGKKAWTKVQSVYIRTISTLAANRSSYIYEEWINLNEPKFINKRSEGGNAVIHMVDHNDGWVVTQNNVSMISPQSITGYLDWHEHYLLVNLKRIAEEMADIELKLKDTDRFDMYVDGKINCGFELNDENRIRKYYSYSPSRSVNSIVIDKYREYKGYVFPLELSTEGAITMYETDYFDPSPLELEKAFNVSFDPNQYSM